MGTAWDAGSLIGTRLGPCLLERLIGVGGAGVVYLAWQERPRRQVAVKVLRAPATSGSEERAQFLARFRREADAAAALDHANIVPIYEFGEEGELAYLVMPYLAGGSLADLLEHEGPLPLDFTVACIAQVGAALDYAHAHGVVHRDVKPSNLLLHPDGRLLLADFGVARMAGDSTGGGTPPPPDMVWGTPEYMAPEQITGEQITAATDIYGLGILVYTLLAGHPPFEGGSAEEIMRRQLSEPPPPLRALRPDVPPRVEEVVSWALAKLPPNRPAGAGTFARALEETAGGVGMAGATAPQRPLGRIAASVQPVAQSLTRLIRRGDAAPGAVQSAAGQPIADQAAAGQAAADQAPTWPAAPARVEPGLPSSPAGWPRIRTLYTPEMSRMVLAILIAVVVLLLAVTRGFTGPGTAGFIPSPGEPANSTPVPAGNTSSGESVALTWLAVTPDHVDLDCSGNRAAEITLSNRGPERMTWRVGIAPLDGISVSPDFGSLRSGASVTVVVTNTSRFTAHNGTLTFKPLIGRAGRPVAMPYTTTACWFGMGHPVPAT